MEDIFNVKCDINSVIEMTEKFLNNLKLLQKQRGKVTLNPNYVNLLKKLFESPDIIMYR